MCAKEQVILLVGLRFGMYCNVRMFGGPALLESEMAGGGRRIFGISVCFQRSEL